MTITSTDKYRIVGEVGSGGMGLVYQAVQNRLDRSVAIKVLKPRYSRDPSFVQRFRQEARALAALPHTHIVQIYDIERVDEDLWIIMEWVEGRTLRDVIDEDGPLSLPRARHILRQCSAALHSAHSAGIVHRDVKPENIILNADDGVKIMDFGIATFLDPQQNLADETQTAGLGSPRYMAPEQLQGEGVDAHTDQYALALIAFEMLTQEFPFPGSDIYAIGYEKLHRASIPLTDRLPEASSKLSRAIRRALAKDPEERFPDLGEFIEAVDPPKRTAISPEAVGLVGACVVILVLGALWILRPSEAPTPAPAPSPPRVVVSLPAPAPEPAPVVDAEPAEEPLVVPEPEPEPDPIAPIIAALDIALAEESYAEAHTLVEELLSHEPGHPRARGAQQQLAFVDAQAQLLSDAVALHEGGGYTEAKGMFRAVLVSDPENPTAQEYIAKIERRERLADTLASARAARAGGENANAKQAYRDVLALAPDNAEAAATLQQIAEEEEREVALAAAEGALGEGALDTAAAGFQAVLDTESTNVRASQGLARIAAVRRDRERFDGAAFAAQVENYREQLLTRIEGFASKIDAAELAVEDENVRRTGRATRNQLREYESAVVGPLNTLIDSIKTAVAELEAFSTQSERKAARAFSALASKQLSVRSQLDNDLKSIAETAASGGGTLASAATRLGTQAEQKLLGSEGVEPIDMSVVNYRKSVRFLARLGRPEYIDPVAEVEKALAPLSGDLHKLVQTLEESVGTEAGVMAAAAMEGVVSRAEQVQNESLIAFSEAQGTFETSHLARTARMQDDLANSTTELKGSLSALRANTGKAQDNYQAGVGAWSEVIGQARSDGQEHFTEHERWTQTAAGSLANATERVHGDVSRALAGEQRLAQPHLATVSEERAWLEASSEQLGQERSGEATSALLAGFATELDRRGGVRGGEYRALRTAFDLRMEDGGAAMSVLDREQSVVLRDRQRLLDGERRRTRDSGRKWTGTLSGYLDASVQRHRATAENLDRAIAAWKNDTRGARATFGNRSRNAHGELLQAVQLAQRRLSVAEDDLVQSLVDLSTGGASDVRETQNEAKERLLRLQEELSEVAVAIHAYNGQLDDAIEKGLAERAKALQMLTTVIGISGDQSRELSESFGAVTKQQTQSIEQGVRELLEASETDMQAFSGRAAELSDGQAQQAESG